ncbi:transposase [Proteus mirabilis]|uniref:transposase n=1 Tax=Proteus mirabilis TaxID=584 RepID=UPI00235DD32F|nr:transposase [Proteus mirabilis]
MKKRINKSYTTEFKQEAVTFVTEQGYSVPKATTSLGITDKITQRMNCRIRASN